MAGASKYPLRGESWSQCRSYIGVFSPVRTQSSGWLWDEDYPALYEMSKRLGRATRLVTFRQRALQDHELLHFVEAEAWQVGVYSPGGHYLPHFDDFDILDPQSYSPDGERESLVTTGRPTVPEMFLARQALGHKVTQ